MKMILVMALIVIIPGSSLQAQIPIVSILTTLTDKLIEAMDIKIEQEQNQVIQEQESQQAIQNELSQEQLGEIGDWVQAMEQLYEEYYQELASVKQIVTDYDEVEQAIMIQGRIVTESQQAYGLFQESNSFSPAELGQMNKIYTGILDQSLQNLDQLLMAVTAFITQMSDEDRLGLINSAYSGILKNYNDLKEFDRQNVQLSLQRAYESGDAGTIQKLYGLQP